jgi:hypothetical protein
MTPNQTAISYLLWCRGLTCTDQAALETAAERLWHEMCAKELLAALAAVPPDPPIPE